MFITTSIKLLQATQQNNVSEIESHINFLKASGLNDAIKELNSDKKKNIFWTNCYNAFFQIAANNNTELFKNQRRTFFTQKTNVLFGIGLSFDDIEHRILRRSKWKFGLGYIQIPPVSYWEKMLRVGKPDYRIHFLLNCGAQSCPIIRPLNKENYTNELEMATKDYLLQEVQVDEEKKEIKLNQLFLFYIKDFGGKKGLLTILKKYGIIDHGGYRFKFTPFDKTLKLNHYISE